MEPMTNHEILTVLEEAPYRLNEPVDGSEEAGYQDFEPIYSILWGAGQSALAETKDSDSEMSDDSYCSQCQNALSCESDDDGYEVNEEICDPDYVYSDNSDSSEYVLSDEHDDDQSDDWVVSTDSEDEDWKDDRSDGDVTLVVSSLGSSILLPTPEGESPTLAYLQSITMVPV